MPDPEYFCAVEDAVGRGTFFGVGRIFPKASEAEVFTTPRLSRTRSISSGTVCSSRGGRVYLDGRGTVVGFEEGVDSVEAFDMVLMIRKSSPSR